MMPAYLDPARALGATDNACGVAIVLELARIVS
jgi:Zn-dependent M28 family amino/carboxypeptidase